MSFSQYIVEQALILVPALYVVGMFLKQSAVDDKYIPVTLLLLGVVGAILMLGLSVHSVIQGIFVAGTAVFANQVIKQLSK